MALHRAILEMGTGNDLHGGDYTKAAIRAVEDALHHSSLTFIRALNIDKDTLQVDVTIGVQKPEEVNTQQVKATLPVGKVSVRTVKGGLDVEDEIAGDIAVIASAAVEVRIER
tara:strand:+ start:44280 stop:44618 length:339 start_codon:yes stop_codon:yes gene_type:complete